MSNQGGDAGNQGWNLGIAAEITMNSNGNDKFKEMREVKIIGKEHACKKSFLANFGHISHNVFLFLLLLLNR